MEKKMRMNQQARLIQILSSQVQRPHRPLLLHIPTENHFGQPPDHNTSLVDEISGLVMFIGNYLAVNCWATHVVEEWRDIKHLCFDSYVTSKYDSFCVQTSEHLNLNEHFSAQFALLFILEVMAAGKENRCRVLMRSVCPNSVQPGMKYLSENSRELGVSLALRKRFSLWVSPHFSLQSLGGLWRFCAKTTDVIVGHCQSRAI